MIGCHMVTEKKENFNAVKTMLSGRADLQVSLVSTVLNNSSGFRL